MSAGFANPRQGINISAGTGIVQTGTVILSNANSVTFGAQASASSTVITASMNIGGTGIGALSAGTTQITDLQVVLSNSNGLSFGADGNTITAQLGALSYWDNQNLRTILAPFPASNGVLAYRRASFGFPITATRGNIFVQSSIQSTAALFTSATYTISLLAYTLTGSTANLASSATVTGLIRGTNATQSNSTWSTFNLSTWNLTPGDYLIATLASATYIVGASAIVGAVGQSPPNTTILAPGGGNYIPYFMQGIYSVTTGSAPSSMRLADVLQTFTSQIEQAYVELLA